MKNSKDLLELLDAYSNTDSISSIRNIEESIVDICCDYLDKLVDCYNAYWDGSDNGFPYESYNKEFGGLSFRSYGDKTINLRYRDSWSYGGSLDEYYSIPVEDIISFDSEKIHDELKNKKLRQLRQQLVSLQAQTDKCANQIKELQS